MSKSQLVADWMSHNDKAIAIEVKEQLCDLFEYTTITDIEIEFDGQGDSGNIEHITLYDSNGEDQSEKFTKIDKIVISLADDLLTSVIPGGWENDTGGCGTVDVDTRKHKVTVSFNERKLAYDRYNYDGETGNSVCRRKKTKRISSVD